LLANTGWLGWEHKRILNADQTPFCHHKFGLVLSWYSIVHCLLLFPDVVVVGDWGVRDRVPKSHNLDRVERDWYIVRGIISIAFAQAELNMRCVKQLAVVGIASAGNVTGILCNATRIKRLPHDA
jgi:hypothetical protein